MTSGIAGRRSCLYDAAALDAVLARMVRRLAGLLAGGGPVTLVGIRRRGVPLAQMLQTRLAADWGMTDVALAELDIKRYADDLTLLHPETRLAETPQSAALDLAGSRVVVVDDVLYRGHSLLRALQYLAQKNPAEVLSAVLVDRDVTLLPVHADVTGVRLDVAPGDIIECHVPPYEADWRIELLRPG